MAITFVGVGAVAAAAVAITPGLPGSLATNDILLLPMRSLGGQAINVANQNGGTWAEIADSPQAGTGEIRGTFYWSRYNGTQGAPTTSDSGTINMGVIIAYRGVIATGDPWDVTAGNTQLTTTAGSIPGDTTTVDGCMICAISVCDRDANSTANATGWTNASLASITERFDEITATGTGGGFAIADGIKTVAGTVDATTWTQAATGELASLMIALKPAIAPKSLLIPRSRRMAGLIGR